MKERGEALEDHHDPKVKLHNVSINSSPPKSNENEQSSGPSKSKPATVGKEIPINLNVSTQVQVVVQVVLTPKPLNKVII